MSEINPESPNEQNEFERNPYEESNTSEKQLSHEEALHLFGLSLSNILASDPLLNDLPSCVTLEEVNSQIALEYGQAMTVNVHKANGEIYPIIIEQKATVQDLKKAIRRFVTLKLTREGDDTQINWRYVWRSYWLYFDGQKLTDNNKKVKDYGISNKAKVSFIKRRRDKK